MQLLMFYLSNNIVPDKDINSIIKNRPDYLRLDSNYIRFFSEKNFDINQFMNIFFFGLLRLNQLGDIYHRIL